MTAFRTGTRNVIAINIHLFMGASCAFVAWIIWPSNPEWWGLGVMSVILWLAAISSLVRAAVDIVAVYRKNREIAHYVAQGGRQKSSRLVTEADMSRTGMLDD